MEGLAILMGVILVGAALYKLAESVGGRIRDRAHGDPSEMARELAHIRDRLDRMEQRLGNLETIVVDRAKEEKFSVLNEAD